MELPVRFLRQCVHKSISLSPDIIRVITGALCAIKLALTRIQATPVVRQRRDTDDKEPRRQRPANFLAKSSRTACVREAIPQILACEECRL